MAALTPTLTVRESLGSVTMMVYKFSSIADGDTFASALGTNVIDPCYWLVGQGNPATQASSGRDCTNSSGNFTFYPGEDSLQGSLFVLARI